MHISRTKFVVLFLLVAFVFLFGSRELLGQPFDAFDRPEGQAGWQAVLSNLLLPVKIVLMGPLVPFIDFLKQDPDAPPPFFLIGFATYWTFLALVIHYVLNRRKPAQ